MPAIRFIVSTHSSARDRNGNCYHFATITSTETGNRLAIDDMGGPDNAMSLIDKHLNLWGYPAVYSVNRTLPGRQWQALRGTLFPKKGETLYEHNLTREMLWKLERTDEA